MCAPAKTARDNVILEAAMEKEVIISIKGMQKYENAEPDTIELVTGGRLERDGESFTLSYQESAVTGMDGTLTTFQIEPERVTLLRWGSTPPKWCFRRGGGTCPCTTPPMAPCPSG